MRRCLPNTDVPRSISGAASSSASVMPIARPVITKPMPRLRFSSGDWSRDHGAVVGVEQPGAEAGDHAQGDEAQRAR